MQFIPYSVIECSVFHVVLRNGTQLNAVDFNEIISADSRQVYRGMDIGTGKDLADYTIHGKQIPYHLIDICEPGTKYNLFEIGRAHV